MIGSCEKGGLALFVDIKKVLWETPASLEKTTPPPKETPLSLVLLLHVQVCKCERPISISPLQLPALQTHSQSQVTVN